MATVQKPERLMGVCVMSAAEQGLQRPGLFLSIPLPPHLANTSSPKPKPKPASSVPSKTMTMKYMIVSIDNELFIFYF